MEHIKTEYFQKLPHLQPVGAAFFVTFRLKGSVPSSMLNQLTDRYMMALLSLKHLPESKERMSKWRDIRSKYLIEFDQLLHIVKEGPIYLANPKILKMIKDILHKYDGDLYDLLSYSIMSNHVHLLFDTSIQMENMEEELTLYQKYTPLDQIMKRIKGPTAVYANRILSRSGQFWERESFDVYIRNEKMMGDVMAYILDNPVKAGITDHWKNHPGTFCKFEE